MYKLQRNHTPGKFICELVSIVLASFFFAAKVVACVYAWWGDPGRFGLEESLRDAFQGGHTLAIQPVLWVHAVWLLAFLWEAIWLLYAISFLCKQRTPRTISVGVFPLFAAACACNIGWVFSWGNQFPELSLAFVALQSILSLTAVAVLTVHLYKITPDVKYDFSCNINFAKIVVLNALMLYGVWSVIVTLINLGAVLQKDAGLHIETTSSVILSLLSSITVSYFILENTILDRFLRAVFVPYPLVVWFLGCVLAEQWQGLDDFATEGQLRNVIFSLVLCCVVGGLLLVRCVLWLLFALFRPLAEYEEEGEFDDPVPISL